MFTSREMLIFLSMHYQGDWKKIHNCVKDKELFTTKLIEETLAKVKWNAITLFDKEYPEWLKTIFMPPYVLYYYGDISLLNNYEKMISVIGSRSNSSYGEEMTNKIVEGLPKDYVIVSGLASGIDTIAHMAAIRNGAKTIAVLGTGIDHCYPIQNKKLYEYIKKNQLVISEYPGDCSTDLADFPNRNRIVAGLAKGVIVTEAYSKSGTSITVNYAMSAGRQVMCVPYPANTDSQCNKWIREGATLVTCAEDVIEEIDNN